MNKIVITYTILFLLNIVSCKKDIENPIKQKDYRVYIATAFSPNGDGLNDKWEINQMPYLPSKYRGYNDTIDTNEWINGFIKYSLKIYTEKHKKIYEIKDHNQSWDGEVHDKKVPSGSYNYTLEFYSTKNDYYRFTGDVYVLY